MNREKTAVITGASSGIGREFAFALAAKGYKTVLIARRRNRLEEVAECIEKVYGADTKIIAADLCCEKECGKLVEELKAEHVEIFINNAGMGRWGRFAETSEDAELEMMDINVRSVHLLTKLMIRYFKRRNIKGYILNVASVAGLMPAGPYMAAYYATKSYIVSLSRAVAAELREEGSDIYVGALCPGPVNTEFDHVAGVDFPLKGLDPKVVAEYGLRKMRKRKVIIIPSFLVKASVIAAKLLPSDWIVKLVARQQKKKKQL